MKVTILDGNPDGQNSASEAYIADLTAALIAEQHQVTVMSLREMDIRYCAGCFGCWVKSPGQCVTKDDSHAVCRAVINSDFTLWAAPLRMGFPSALLKKTMDKSIPLVHPYFAVDQGEAHHRARYAHYPRVGLLLQKEADTDEEDLHIVAELYSRAALNMKSHLAFVCCTDQPVEHVLRAMGGGADAGRVGHTRNLLALAGTRVEAPSRLTIYNGSPRGVTGNTPLMLDQVAKGFTAGDERSFEILHLANRQELAEQCQAFAKAEAVLLGFPLYIDAMPGIVKRFIEALEPLRKQEGNPPLGFLVQSGFPESLHSRYVERYLAKLAARLGSPYLGTIVKGGCDGVRSMPEQANRRLFGQLFEIGKTFAATGRFDPALLHTLAKPERYPAHLILLVRLLNKTPLLSMYWDNQLKANGVYEQRFARPFLE